MTKLTHKQAQRYLRMDLDGLLSPAQHADLETHLRDCESCRSDSESLSALTTRLQTEFHARWNDHDGPSKQVLENVRSQTRRIMMQKRFDLVFNLLGGVAALLVLFFVINSVVAQLQKKSAASNGNQTATPASLSQGKLIAFVSKQNGNNDIYTMNSDGSDVINLTNNPADDNFPVWSPDGAKIAFISDRDGNENIYVMNFDGSNLTRITDDTGQDTNPLWSPAGTKIAYASGDSSKNNTNIYVIDTDGQNKKRLTNYMPNITVSPERWSPDSQFILFEVNRQIVQVSIQDGNLTPLTPQVEDSMFTPTDIVLSADGSTLTYLTECDQRERGNSGFCKKVQSIQRYATQATTTQDALRIQNICELKDPSHTLAYYWQTKWSPDHTKIISAFFCEGHGGIFYLANADGSDFKPLTNDPILTKSVDFDWSYDSQSIVLSSTPNDSNHDGLSTLNIYAALANPNTRPTPLNTSATQVSWLAWQPVPNYDAAIIPTPQPQKKPTNDRLIAFTSEKDGNAEIYTIKSDGSGLKNLTNNPLAKDTNPIWSPDGNLIAYESELNGFTQIYLMNADGTHVVQLTSDQTNHALGTWSPDGQKITYISSKTKDTNTGNLYVMNADGSNKIVLTKEEGIYSLGGWSPDSQTILYDVQVGDASPTGSGTTHFAMNADGTNSRKLLEGGGFVSPIHWQDNQHFITIVYTGAWRLYQFNTDGSAPVNIGDAASSIDAWFWGDAQITYAVKSWQDWQWYRAAPRIDSTKQKPFSTWKNFPKDCKQYVNDLYMGSPQAATSPDGKQAIVNIHCDEGGSWLYLVNADGSLIQPLTNTALFQETNTYVSVSPWSPDGKQILLTTTDNQGRNDLYVLNMDNALRDPSTQPIHLANIDGQFGASWQPIVNNDVVQVNPTPESTPTFRFGEPVETKEQALIAAHAPMNGNFNYVGTPVVVKVQKGSPEEFSAWAGSSIPSPKQVWIVVYFNEAWKSTFVASSKFAYDENGAVVTLPPDILTPPPPFRGCVVVVIDASNGHTVSYGPLQQYLIPECDK